MNTRNTCPPPLAPPQVITPAPAHLHSQATAHSQVQVRLPHLLARLNTRYAKYYLLAEIIFFH